MRHIPSKPLSARALRWLKEWTRRIEAAPAAERKRIADERWEAARKTKAMKEVKSTLTSLNGLLTTHCMYCEYNEGPHIDHFEPRASDPTKTFFWDNLHLACSNCDSNQKRDRFLRPGDGTRPLSPRNDFPELHLQILPSGKIRSFSERGAWSIDLFGLDRKPLEDGRADQWTMLELLIQHYADCRQRQSAKAEKVAMTIQRGRFHSVLRDLVAAANGPKSTVLGLGKVQEAIQQCPEVLSWAGVLH